MEAEGDVAGVFFTSADDEHGMHLGLFGALDFAVNFVGTEVAFHADPGGAEFLDDGVGVIDEGFFITDGEDADLFRGEPEGEVAGVMFDEEADEAFVGSEGCPVDAEGGFVGIIAVAVGEAEAFRDGEVDLVGGEGKFAADGAPDLDIDFRAVEGGFVGDFDVIDAAIFEDIPDHVFGLDPEFGFIDEFLAEA
ncbi:MAG: hypothetical protein RI897_3936 [Verrucomicrobiota bacterium]